MEGGEAGCRTAAAAPGTTTAEEGTAAGTTNATVEAAAATGTTTVAVRTTAIATETDEEAAAATGDLASRTARRRRRARPGRLLFQHPQPRRLQLRQQQLRQRPRLLLA